MLVCSQCGAENREGARFCDSCGAALAEAAAPREVRKVVTVLFCDVTGSTALGERIDPESLRRVMARYFETAKTIVERHGGTVEKFIGDAVMAVFGVPAVHEDDALRAVRAADELRAGLGELHRRDDAPMVGRQRQLQLLEHAFAAAAAERSCHLVTILGSAGVGKSRLTEEFLSALEGAAIVRGRCLSYGEGISYWPVTEVVKQLEPDASESTTLAAILGDEAAASSPDEIAWAFRKLLESRAADRPLVVVFDDVHWGEPAFLDLVEHVADLSRGAPILLLCMARPELLDRRPAWGGGKLNATNVLLEPLASEEAGELIDTLSGEIAHELRDRILDAAEGNPL